MDFRRCPILRMVIQKLWRKADTSRKDNDELLVTARERDLERNFQTTPPSEEQIDLHCIWAVEFYTPTHIDSLVESLKKLGVGSKADQRLSRDPIAWLRMQRSLHRTSGWINLGVLKPVGSKEFRGWDSIETSLPCGVEYANWRLFSLSPSLTCIVVGFVFDEQAAGMLDIALRSDCETYLEPIGERNTIRDPESQKKDLVGLARKRISESSKKWFDENVPGLFCSDLLNGKLPTCELTFLKEADPFPTRLEGQGIPPRYLRVLGLDAAFEVWESTNISGLKFKPSDRRDQYNQYHSILSMKESEIPNSFIDHGGEKKSSMFNSLDMSFPDIFNLWAIISMLEGYTRHLVGIRDSASFRLGTNQNTINKLQSLGDDVSFSLDVSAVTADLISSANDKFRLFGPIEKFRLCSPAPDEEETLGEALFSAIGEEAKSLMKLDRSIRNHLTQFGSLLAAAENVRLQRSISNMTRAILFLAFLVPLFTWLSTAHPDWWEKLLAWWDKLFAFLEKLWT